MVIIKTITIVELAISAVLSVVGAVGYFAARSVTGQAESGKKQKRKKSLFFCLMLAALWFLVGTVLTALSGSGGGMEIEFQMFSKRVTLFGISFAETTVMMWVIMAVALVFGLVFRFLLFPRFDPDRPKNAFQNLMELSVEATENFTKGVVGEYGAALAPYMFSLAVFMILSAASELLGFRPATSDILVTLAMGLITLVLINYYGFKKKGFGGRIKSMSQPTPVIFPMKVLSDIAVPVSLACRLFGNMIGGMIVMDLLKSALGGYASGIPAVAGLYFNLFHPLIQTYIFVILSLTFINEAME